MNVVICYIKVMARETVRLILRRRGYKKLPATARASQALAQLQSSHDAIFVFRGEQFLGLLSLYYSFWRHRPPANERVERLLYHPPRLELKTSLMQTARLMLLSRLYWLPVLADRQFLGVVTAADLLNYFLRRGYFRRPLGQIIRLTPLETVTLNEKIAHARALMLRRHLSRLLVVGRQQQPQGILSSYDLRARLPLGKQERVAAAYHHGLLEVDINLGADQVLKRLLTQKEGSLVVREKGEIKGVISYRNFLRYLVERVAPRRWRLSLRLQLPPEDKLRLEQYLDRLFRRRGIWEQKVAQLDLILSHQGSRHRWQNYRLLARITTKKQHFLTMVRLDQSLWRGLRQLSRQLRRRLER